MNLPILPTDNFYKFTALSGLAIIAFCIVFPFQRINAMQLRIIEIQTHIEILKIDIENIRNDILDSLSTKGISSIKKQALMRKALEDFFKREDITELSKSWKGEPVLNVKEQAVFRKQSNELRMRLAKIKGEEENLKFLYNELHDYYFILRVGGWVGLILFLSGLCLWYFITQRPNDILLQKQIRGKD